MNFTFMKKFHKFWEEIGVRTQGNTWPLGGAHLSIFQALPESLLFSQAD